MLLTGGYNYFSTAANIENNADMIYYDLSRGLPVDISAAAGGGGLVTQTFDVLVNAEIATSNAITATTDLIGGVIDDVGTVFGDIIGFAGGVVSDIGGAIGIGFKVGQNYGWVLIIISILALLGIGYVVYKIVV